MYVNGIDEEETYTSIHLLGGNCLFVRDDIIIAALCSSEQGSSSEDDSRRGRVWLDLHA